jgi:hypothetical protein
MRFINYSISGKYALAVQYSRECFRELCMLKSAELEHHVHELMLLRATVRRLFRAEIAGAHSNCFLHQIPNCHGLRVAQLFPGRCCPASVGAPADRADGSEDQASPSILVCKEKINFVVECSFQHAMPVQRPAFPKSCNGCTRTMHPEVSCLSSFVGQRSGGTQGCALGCQAGEERGQPQQDACCCQQHLCHGS